MLYHLLYPLHEHHILFNVVKYITFRTFMAIFTAMAICLIFGPAWIRFLKKRQFEQTLWDYVPKTHHETKKQTPTLGGVLLWSAIGISSLLWSRWDAPLIWMVLALSLMLGAVGFLDDYKKVMLKDAHGLKARYKFPLQLLCCGIIVLVLFDSFGMPTQLSVPFFKTFVPDLGNFYPWLALVILVGASNAVNLTDGLDGLATGPSIIAFLAFGVLAYLVSNIRIADYLQIAFIPQAAELAVFCGAVMGGLLGFLWFNAHPAEIFMGDVGSLPLGGALGFVAIATKNELLLLLVGGVFVLETLSVIVQVTSFKLTGKRVFRMAPVHHHCELKGWPESKVIVRFWIISIVLALIGLSTLKLR